MYEIWTYNVSLAADKVYYAVWGGGVLEYDVKTEHWKDYNDPDGETELVVHKGPGPDPRNHHLGELRRKDKILWVATYFGASRYDGRNWNNFLEKDSGLPSNFLNQVKAVDGTEPGSPPTKVWPTYDGETGPSTANPKCWCATHPAK